MVSSQSLNQRPLSGKNRLCRAGVTVGEGHGDRDRDRDRDVIRDRDHQDRDKTVILKRAITTEMLTNDRRPVVIDKQ
jgi:hypothetical protein